jgi:MoxR-like ATPase
MSEHLPTAKRITDEEVVLSAARKDELSASDMDAVKKLKTAFDEIRRQMGRVIVGQEEVIEQLLIAMFGRGHCMLEGVPGLAKTLMISTLAQCLSLEFKRIQFTPDLMPSDITGTDVIEENRSTGGREFRFLQGPLFANVILADEINRTPPKTQAALLEAMQERQVTAGGVRHELPNPFFVLATQNPIEQEGTYPLPEAQLDRFMYQIQIRYPSADEEFEIVRRSATKAGVESATVLTADDIRRVQALVLQTPVADHVIRYALRLVRATRVKEPMEGGHARPKMVQAYLSWGAGPRASEYLVLAAKAKAILSGSTHVTPEHVKQVAYPVLRHRIMTNFNAEADQITPDAIVTDLLTHVPVEGASASEKKLMDSVMR